MRVDYVSDVHISHYVPFSYSQEKWEKRTKQWTKELLKDKKGEVLIVAGDMSEWNQQSTWFFEECSVHYERVYFTVGNHDYYLMSRNQLNKYGNSKNRVNELIENLSHLDNIIPLNGNVDTYKGVVFAGHSLWYKLETEFERYWYKENSNDSRKIFYQEGYKESHELLYEESMEFYNSLDGIDIDVFVSHIPPMDPPFSQYPYNACYAAPVPFLVGKHWVCGHQHVQGTFKFDETTFYMNPLGYPSEKIPVRLQTFTV